MAYCSMILIVLYLRSTFSSISERSSPLTLQDIEIRDDPRCLSQLQYSIIFFLSLGIHSYVEFHTSLGASDNGRRCIDVVR